MTGASSAAFTVRRLQRKKQHEQGICVVALVDRELSEEARYLGSWSAAEQRDSYGVNAVLDDRDLPTGP